MTEIKTIAYDCGVELDDNYFDTGAERMRNHIKNE